MIINQISKHALVSCLLFLVSLGYGAKKESGWIQLFNGKDLSDWTVKIRGHRSGVNHNDTFSVKDGVIQVSYDKYENFNETLGICFTKPLSLITSSGSNIVSLANKLRWSWLGLSQQRGHASRANPRKHGQRAGLSDSIGVQFLGGKGEGKRTTANLYPGTDVVMNKKLLKRHCIGSKSKTYHGDQWVTVEIEVRGSKSIKHVIDGETVLEYTKPQLDDGALLEGGTISFSPKAIRWSSASGLKKLKK